MSYIFSSSTLPIGYSIVGSDLVIASDAPVFNGVITIVLTDGVTTVSQTISINGSDTTVSPVDTEIINLSSETGYSATFQAVVITVAKVISAIGSNDSFSLSSMLSLLSAMGFSDSFVLRAIAAIPAIARGGQSRTIGGLQFIVPVGPAISRGGQSRMIGDLQFVPPSGLIGRSRGGQSRTIGGLMAISIQQGSLLTMAAGDVTSLSAQITVDSSTVGVSQAVTWSIVSGTYSGYGSISASGVLTTTNGSYQYGDATFVVRVTSVAVPTLTKTIAIYAIDRFTGIQVTPSASSVAAGAVLTIGSLLQGVGSNLNGSNVSLISVAVSQDSAAPVTLSGNSVTYTAGSTTGTINIVSTFFYPAGNYQVQGSATVQNVGAPLTVVPSYTVSSVGDTPYGSMTYTALNDADSNTGFAINTSGGFPLIVVDLGSAKLIKKIQIAGGYLGGAFGASLAQFLNFGFLEYSSDSTTWTAFASIAGVVDTPGVYSEYAPNITARYWRLRRSTWLATSAFVFYT